MNNRKVPVSGQEVEFVCVALNKNFVLNLSCNVSFQPQFPDYWLVCFLLNIPPLTLCLQQGQRPCCGCETWKKSQRPSLNKCLVCLFWATTSVNIIWSLLGNENSRWLYTLMVIIFHFWHILLINPHKFYTLYHYKACFVVSRFCHFKKSSKHTAKEHTFPMFCNTLLALFYANSSQIDRKNILLM